MNEPSLDLQDRLLSSVVHYEKFDEALRVFGRLTDFSLMGGKAQGLLLVGESSNGKTTLAREMIELYPVVREEERMRIRVIMLSMPANPTIRTFCMRLLDSFGRHYGNRDSEAKLTQEVLELLKGCGTAMLIIDEAQHLVDGKKINKTPAEVADWIKQLMNDANVSVSLIGTPRVEQLLVANGQLRSRFSRKIELTGYSIDCQESIQDFCNIVARLIKESEFTGDPSYIYDTNALSRLYHATDGRIGYIAKLLAEAIWICQSQNEDALTREHFAKAFETVVWFGASSKNNPFDGELNYRKLVEEGEPFFPGEVH